jgi:hypothetical protein
MKSRRTGDVRHQVSLTASRTAPGRHNPPRLDARRQLQTVIHVFITDSLCDDRACQHNPSSNSSHCYGRTIPGPSSDARRDLAERDRAVTLGRTIRGHDPAASLEVGGLEIGSLEVGGLEVGGLAVDGLGADGLGSATKA